MTTIEVIVNILAFCGFVGISDVLLFRGEIGVFLSKYIGIRK